MIAAILRAPVYSPNHIGIDADILNLTAEQLRRRGHRVRILSEEDLIGAGDIEEETVVHMCRHQRSLEILAEKEARGATVVNSAASVENCLRERVARILLGSGIAFPDSLVVQTDTVVTADMESAGLSEVWIKRGYTFPRHREDITFVRTPAQAQQIVQEYFLRGIKRAVISRHMPGRLIQFYGVGSAGYFSCLGPDGHRAPSELAERMRSLAVRAAEALETDIYGGQAILGADERLTIVDFNDFPSFAPVVKEASRAIARALLSAMKGDRGRS